MKTMALIVVAVALAGCGGGGGKDECRVIATNSPGVFLYEGNCPEGKASRAYTEGFILQFDQTFLDQANGEAR
jgi:hypothetical protein